ncbi:hypothetical protein DSECCO2_503960 [anaerobic digester metagenome]
MQRRLTVDALLLIAAVVDPVGQALRCILVVAGSCPLGTPGHIKRLVVPAGEIHVTRFPFTVGIPDAVAVAVGDVLLLGLRFAPCTGFGHGPHGQHDMDVKTV